MDLNFLNTSINSDCSFNSSTQTNQNTTYSNVDVSMSSNSSVICCISPKHDSHSGDPVPTEGNISNCINKNSYLALTQQNIDIHLKSQYDLIKTETDALRPFESLNKK